MNFIMNKEGVSYHDALMQLARRYGIEVEERELTEEEKRQRTERESMLVANEWAMRKMESDLTDTEEGRNIGLQYLYGRSVTPAAIKAFRLGYALDKGHALIDAARNAGFDLRVLKALGLIGTSQQGHDYDRFKGRVIFPILNAAGKVVAFGGRDLKGGPAKYINSPESTLYSKSNELYGIYQARSSIVKEDKCFLVEGYLDVIGMWQSGMENTVASSGTALTDGQIALIHRFTKRVTLIYDGDAAGIKASLRGINMLLSHGMEVKVLRLPGGDDPDSFAKKHTPEEFRKYVATHETDIIRFKISVLMDEVRNDPGRRAGAVRSVVESIAVIPDRIQRDVYVQECARLMEIPEETVTIATLEERAKVMDNLRRQREHQRLDRETVKAEGNGDKATPSPSQSDSSIDIQPSTVLTAPSTTDLRSNPFYPLERAVAIYLVKYAFLRMSLKDAETGEQFAMPVWQYVKEDLEFDDISFTVPVFKKIFEQIERMASDFDSAFRQYHEKLEKDAEDMRRKGYDDIASRNPDMASIESEEKNLEAKIEKERLDKEFEFTRHWPGDTLLSHEDDELRTIVTEFISEPYQLSNIYLKNGNSEREENRLDHLLPRAITEWKTEILNHRIRELMASFAGAAESDDEKVSDIQNQIRNLVAIRSRIAKEIGDRILAPKRLAEK